MARDSMQSAKHIVAPAFAILLFAGVIAAVDGAFGSDNMRLLIGGFLTVVAGLSWWLIEDKIVTRGVR